MYPVSDALKSVFDSKALQIKIALADGTALDGGSTPTISYTASCCSDNIGIGNVCAACIKISLDGIFDLLDQMITIQVGTDLNGTAQYIPLGTFAVTECSTTEDTTTITGYDAAYYAMAGTYEPTVASGATVSEVIADIAAQCGLEVDSSYIYDGTATVNGDLTGHTCRDMLGLMAMLTGRNVVVSRDGKIRLVWFQNANAKITPDEYYEGEYSNGGETALTGITCTVAKQTTVTDEEGNTSTEETTETLTVGNDSNQITVENPFMTQTILNSLWLDIGNYTYSIAECSFFGGLLVEPGDLLTVENRAGSASNVPVMAVELSLDGGCKAKISAFGQGTTQASAGGYLGPTARKIEAMKTSINLERTARELAVSNLAQRLGDSSGLYQTTQVQGNGSNIYYLHNKSTLDKSLLIIKLTAGGIGISQDGGATFPYGFDFVTGDAIAKTIYSGAAWIEQLFSTEITATNLHITGNSTFGGTLGEGVVTKDNLSSDVEKDITAAVLRIDSSRGTVFKNSSVSTVLSAVIFYGGQRITDRAGLTAAFGSGAYLEWSWQRMGEEAFGVISADDSRLSEDGFSFTLSADDVDTKVVFQCSLNI